MATFLDRLSQWLNPEPPAPEPAPPPSAPPLPAIDPDDPRIPSALRARVARLLALVADVEARAVDDPLGASPLAEVRQLRERHLPGLIASYAEIPAEHRAEIFRATGRSASYNLGEAIDRMIARVERLSRGLAQEHLDSFATQIRFIEHRYGEDPLG